MLISSSTTQPLPAVLPDAAAATSNQGSLAQPGATATSAKAARGAASESAHGTEGARVTLTAPHVSNGNIPDFAPVYAEIWKNGMKVAEIDVHGGVTSVSGIVAAAHGTVGNGGALLAARRAAEIVRSIGGEIRVGGQLMDSQTLDMRAKLKMAYGA